MALNVSISGSRLHYFWLEARKNILEERVWWSRSACPFRVSQKAFRETAMDKEQDKCIPCSQHPSVRTYLIVSITIKYRGFRAFVIRMSYNDWLDQTRAQHPIHGIFFWRYLLHKSPHGVIIWHYKVSVNSEFTILFSRKHCYSKIYMVIEKMIYMYLRKSNKNREHEGIRWRVMSSWDGKDVGRGQNIDILEAMKLILTIILMSAGSQWSY